MRLYVSAVVIFFIPAFGLGQTADEIKETIKYVYSLQQDDGGYIASLPDRSLDQKPTSSLRATTAALRAIRYFGGVAPNQDKAALFISRCFDEKIGAFSDKPNSKPDVISTAIGVMAVAELKMDEEHYILKCLAYLEKNAKEYEEIRLAAAGFEAVKKQPADHVKEEWMKLLRRTMNSDSTSGSGEGKVRDTGSTTAILLRLNIKFAVTKELTSLLQEGQRDDGGYGKAGGAKSDLETTYRVTRSVHMLKLKPRDVEKMRMFIGKCRNPDGGYGVEPGKPSSVGSTYFASIILNWIK